MPTYNITVPAAIPRMNYARLRRSRRLSAKNARRATAERVLHAPRVLFKGFRLLRDRQQEQVDEPRPIPLPPATRRATAKTAEKRAGP